MGQKTGTDERVLADAARWHARLIAHDCTDFERAQFQRWRAASARHAQAYESAEAVSRRLEALAGFDETLRSMADAAFAMGVDDDPRSGVRQKVAHSHSRHTSRWIMPAALAASIFTALVGVQLVG